MRTYPAIAGLAYTNTKERREKGKNNLGGEKMRAKRIKPQRVKPCTPAPTIDVLLGYEEQNEKHKKETGSEPRPRYPGPFSRLLRPAGIIR